MYTQLLEMFNSDPNLYPPPPPPPPHTHTQYFSTVGPSLEPNHVPWLPLSVICSPALGDDDSSSGEVTPRDQESYLNALLSELGPEERNEREKRGATPPGEAVGGLVSCLLIPGDTDTGGEEIRAGESKETVQLQRIASRCHCQIFYVTYGGIVETAVHKSPPILSVSCSYDSRRIPYNFTRD